MIRIRKILLPTDFSACARQAMNHAAHLARQFQAELHLLHVLVLYEHDPQKIAPHLADIERLHDLLAEHAVARLDAAIRPMRNAAQRYPAHWPGVLRCELWPRPFLQSDRRHGRPRNHWDHPICYPYYRSAWTFRNYAPEWARCRRGTYQQPGNPH